MKKYIVRVNILKSDKEGTFNSENFEYTFQESFLMEARNKAISKVKSFKSSLIMKCQKEVNLVHHWKLNLKE